jgi:hypothetical protein
MEIGEKFQCRKELEIIIFSKQCRENCIKVGDFIEIGEHQVPDGIFIPIIFEGDRIIVHPKRFEHHFFKVS